MIIGTLTLLSILFSAGDYSGAFFELPNVQKIIKNAITDDGRRESALELSNAYFDQVKEKRKEGESILKDIEELSETKSTDKKVLEIKLNEYLNIDYQLQDLWIKTMTDIKQFIREDEFKAILEKGVSNLKESEGIKVEAKREKYFKGVEESINKRITDEKKKERALELFYEYKTEVESLYKEQKEISFSVNSVLNNYESGVQEYKDSFINYNDQNKKVLMSYLDVHYNMMDLLDDSEWKNLQKDIKKILSES